MKNLFKIAVERGVLTGIENSVVCEIRGSLWLVCRHETNEFLPRHWLQRVVHQPLNSQWRDRVGGEILSAKRAGSVGWVDEGFIGKFQKLVVQRVIKVGAEVVGTPPQRRAQVGAANIADEQRLTSDSLRGRCEDWYYPKMSGLRCCP